MLKIENLHAYYRGNHALKGVSLEVAKGEIVCLIGSNGAGKTTLLNCISGLHDDRTGVISFRNKNVSLAQPHESGRIGSCAVPRKSPIVWSNDRRGKSSDGRLY